MEASAAAAAAGTATAGGHGGGNLMGVGMAPEGIEQNPVVYEFMSELAYGAAARRLAGRAAEAGAGAGGRPLLLGLGGGGGPSKSGSLGSSDTVTDAGADGSDEEMAEAEPRVAAERAEALQPVALQPPPDAHARQRAAMDAWFTEYAARRYAAAGRLAPPAAELVAGAWRRLGRTAYACGDGYHNTVCDIPTSRPGLARSEITGWGLAPHYWYPLAELRTAIADLIAASDHSPDLLRSSAYRYDVVDGARELLSKASGVIWGAVCASYAQRQSGALAGASGALVAALEDLDRLLGAHEGFMLGPALARARAFAAGCCDGEEGGGEGAGGRRRRELERLYERSLRTQVRGRVNLVAVGRPESASQPTEQPTNQTNPTQPNPTKTADDLGHLGRRRRQRGVGLRQQAVVGPRRHLLPAPLARLAGPPRV
jgi:hypothetical protein